ncbi:nucleotide disphospho-sugar-binding domain-containing protein [Streptomyces celluloflavus]|uniref:nucleotide disphospho-sugar-binding domain-containing protein n=1 Tax=Streptomyces celluloflavus TaxID=58344 RepID=UPI0036D881A9
MRVLMIPSPAATHFMPLVPLAWALRAAGHELLVAGQPDVLGVARQAGLNAVSLGDWFRADEELRRLLPPGKRPLEVIGRWTAEQLSEFPPNWLVHSERVLPEYVAFAREFRPDVIVSDALECNVLAVGGTLGIPVVHHRYGVDPLSGPFLTGARRALRRHCAELGLAELPDPTVVLDPCPPGLQLPELAPGRPIRYVPFNGSGELPGWLRERRPAGSPVRRVAVSLGSMTLELNGVPLLRRILAAFEGLPDVEAVATVPEAHRAAVGPVPDGVRMVDPVPLHLLFADCDAVVHHGGTGTGMTATSFGLPQLVLPQLADQFAYGERLAAAGAAVILDGAAHQDDPVRLRAALESVVAEPGHRKAAEELRRAMGEMPAPSRVAADLEQLVQVRDRVR